MLNTMSMVETVNNVNEAMLHGHPIPRSEATQIAEFIAGRQGAEGNYGGLFGPAEGELLTGYRLFSGDSVKITNASARHILGEESLRILRLLDVHTPLVQAALERAQESFRGILERHTEKYKDIGTFCCGKCTVAYWRALTTGWLPDARERFKAGMQSLHDLRQDGQWRRMPFFYTVLCLTELPAEITKEERMYAHPFCERVLLRLRKDSPTYANRSVILEKLIVSLEWDCSK